MLAQSRCTRWNLKRQENFLTVQIHPWRSRTETRINIDFIGKIDGIAFDGGSTEGQGTDLVIGSGTYIDNVEDQLVGAHPGDKVEVTATFPDDYGAEELAGKEAVFDVTVNGMYR